MSKVSLAVAVRVILARQAAGVKAGASHHANSERNLAAVENDLYTKMKTLFVECVWMIIVKYWVWLCTKKG